PYTTLFRSAPVSYSSIKKARKKEPPPGDFLLPVVYFPVLPACHFQSIAEFNPDLPGCLYQFTGRRDLLYFGYFSIQGNRSDGLPLQAHHAVELPLRGQVDEIG